MRFGTIRDFWFWDQPIDGLVKTPFQDEEGFRRQMKLMSDAKFEEHVARTDRKIKCVFVFDNGMCAVTDQFGQQMPEFQGRWVEVEEKVRKAAGNEVEWNGVEPSKCECGHSEVHHNYGVGVCTICRIDNVPSACARFKLKVA